MKRASPELTYPDAVTLVRLSNTKGREAAALQFPRFRLISTDAAKEVFADSEVIDWDCITELSADAAAYCFERFGIAEECDARDANSELRLNGLETLSETTAAVLGSYSLGPLALNGLQNLAPAAAKHLSRLAFGQLQLNGITELEPLAFRWLVSTYDGVSLNKLQALDLTHLHARRNEPGGGTGGGPLWQIHLKGIAHLPKAWSDEFGEMARAFRLESSQYATDHCIDLEGLRVLNSRILAEESARTLRDKSGACLHISFDRIESITVEAADGLVSRLGDMDLPALASLSPDIAAVAARKCREVSLDGLTELSDEAAAAFRSFSQHLLSFNGLTCLSDNAFESLVSSYADAVQLNGLKRLTSRQRQTLALANCKSVSLTGSAP